MMVRLANSRIKLRPNVEGRLGREAERWRSSSREDIDEAIDRIADEFDAHTPRGRAKAIGAMMARCRSRG